MEGTLRRIKSIFPRFTTNKTRLDVFRWRYVHLSACVCISDIHLYAIVSSQFPASFTRIARTDGRSRSSRVNFLKRRCWEESSGQSLLAKDIFHCNLLLSLRSRWRKSPWATPRIAWFSWKISNWIISWQPLVTVPSFPLFSFFRLNVFFFTPLSS